MHTRPDETKQFDEIDFLLSHEFYDVQMRMGQQSLFKTPNPI